MDQPNRLTELLARMWIECDPNRDSSAADEILPVASPNPLAGKPRWHWFIPRADATIAYLAKHGLEIREIGK